MNIFDYEATDTVELTIVDPTAGAVELGTITCYHSLSPQYQKARINLVRQSTKPNLNDEEIRAETAKLMGLVTTEINLKGPDGKSITKEQFVELLSKDSFYWMYIQIQLGLAEPSNVFTKLRKK